MMRKIDRIVIHCSATRETQNVSIRDIEAMHKGRGFKFDPPNAAGLRHVGYHFYVRRNGTVELGRPLGEAGAHVEGYNARSIGICYEGGLDANGKPKDTRTPEQKAAIAALSKELALRFKVQQSRITGHRDLSPDKNGNGVVEPHEYLKACPCFSVPAERAGWFR